MYSLAADFLGGAPSIQIPIKLNKAVPSSAHQSNAPMADAITTADQELLVKTTLSSVWSQISSLGGLPSPATCAAPVTPPSCRLRADRAGHVVAGAHGHSGALPALAQSNVSCAAVASLAARSSVTPSRACAVRSASRTTVLIPKARASRRFTLLSARVARSLII
jgi:hypothetical protein